MQLCNNRHMENERPLVSALVLNYRSPRDTVKCVSSLLDQTIADRLEILVGDNSSQDESIGMFRARWKTAHAHVHIIETGANRGYGKGNNFLARFALGRYLLIINPDNTVPADAVGTMVRLLEEHPDIGILGPALMHPDGSFRPSARRFPTFCDLLWKRFSPASWQRAYQQRMAAAGSGLIDVDWLVGACLLMKRDLFSQLDGFDPRFFLFFEDIDLCRRAKLLGKRIAYIPSVRILDRHLRLSGHTILSLFTRRTTRIHFGSALKYFWKWKNLPIAGSIPR